VLRETLDSGGENLRRGMQNTLDDLRLGAIKVAGKEQFTVSKNLALTPGQVIFLPYGIVGTIKARSFRWKEGWQRWLALLRVKEKTANREK